MSAAGVPQSKSLPEINHRSLNPDILRVIAESGTRLNGIGNVTSDVKTAIQRLLLAAMVFQGPQGADYRNQLDTVLSSITDTTTQAAVKTQVVEPTLREAQNVVSTPSNGNSTPANSPQNSPPANPPPRRANRQGKAGTENQKENKTSPIRRAGRFLWRGVKAFSRGFGVAGLTVGTGISKFQGWFSKLGTEVPGKLNDSGEPEAQPEDGLLNTAAGVYKHAIKDPLHAMLIKPANKLFVTPVNRIWQNFVGTLGSERAETAARFPDRKRGLLRRIGGVLGMATGAGRAITNIPSGIMQFLTGWTLGLSNGWRQIWETLRREDRGMLSKATYHLITALPRGINAVGRALRNLSALIGAPLNLLNDWITKQVALIQEAGDNSAANTV